jgi:predicted NBD/HSP70 family sugar kinase
MTIGMDLGDKTSRCCVLNGDGEVIQEQSVATLRACQEITRTGLGSFVLYWCW